MNWGIHFMVNPYARCDTEWKYDLFFNTLAYIYLLQEISIGRSVQGLQYFTPEGLEHRNGYL